METCPIPLEGVGGRVSGWVAVGEGEGGTERAPVLLASTCRFVKKNITTHVRPQTTVTTHGNCSWIVYLLLLLILLGPLLRVGVGGCVRGGGVYVGGWVTYTHTCVQVHTQPNMRAHAHTRNMPLRHLM